MQQLRDPNTNPDPHTIASALGSSWPAYEKLAGEISGPPFKITFEWRWYNDGKAWLCKATAKGKTVFWLSAWDGYFKTSFYFTEKTGAGIATLEIDPSHKSAFASAKPIGKLIPLTLDIKQEQDLKDLLELITFKQKGSAGKS
jgi:hypothetical protein